ncbi:MAG: lytic murein transglycosylase [Oligoflexia bacterium]|nr:lytic murein transglycosylase [Oligoflexia bacterium]
MEDTSSLHHKNQASPLISCGGDFNSFIEKLKEKSYQMGYEPFIVEKFFKNVKQDSQVIKRDRSQGIFKKTFIEFSKLVMSDYRISKGKQFSAKHEQTFSVVYQKYGVPPAVLLSFLALETDYGAVQGDFNTLNSLVTLSHDCRRPELFQPHIFSALNLFKLGNFDPDLTKGAWAGEVGMIQMLPKDIVLYGVDQDGDGKVNLQSSVPDVLMTAGNTLNKLGWEPYQPWLTEIIAPQSLNWAETGLNNLKTLAEWKRLGVKIRSGIEFNETLKTAVLLPQGRNGPAFFAFPNYQVYLQWNKSFVYSTTSAFFAALLAGEPMYYEGHPSPPLSDDELKRLQIALTERGYDVGGIDGIIGAKTRFAIQKEQIHLGLPADAWPTKELLSLLEQ